MTTPRKTIAENCELLEVTRKEETLLKGKGLIYDCPSCEGLPGFVAHLHVDAEKTMGDVRVALEEGAGT